MNRKEFLKTAGISAVAAATAGGCAQMAKEKRPLNFVVIFLDDSGWSDFQPFADPPYETPNVKQLASEGCRYNQFYVPQAVCSASRAALLTGCYPGRTKMFSAHPPRARGLDPKYATIGQILQKKGYATAVYGKWHVGDQPDTRPPARGFKESCGLMCSNDMWKYHATSRNYDNFPLQFWDNGEITIEDVTPEDQTHLTTWYTEHAVDFINRRKDEPFFLYVPHSMPHVPLYCSTKFAGKSGVGLYGDVMMEIDWSVGQITAALKKNGLENDTVVIFTSDNGPWISYGNHAGKTPFREAKATSFDGGKRSACVIKYPGEIKAGSSCDDAFCSIDITPTLVALAGADLPENPVDGKNVWDLITGKDGAVNPHEYYPFSIGNNLQGVISGDGRWKLHLPHSYRSLATDGKDGLPGQYENKDIELSLFDMETDPYETTNVIDRYPDIGAKMKSFADNHIEEFYKK